MSLAGHRVWDALDAMIKARPDLLRDIPAGKLGRNAEEVATNLAIALDEDMNVPDTDIGDLVRHVREWLGTGGLVPCSS